MFPVNPMMLMVVETLYVQKGATVEADLELPPQVESARGFTFKDAFKRASPKNRQFAVLFGYGFGH